MATVDRTKLMLSRDRKVSPISRRRIWHGSTMWVPSIRNSFGLPAGTSCPGMTEFCKDCYAVPTERQWPGVNDGMRRNYDLLIEAGGVDGMEALLDEAMDRYNKQWRRAGLSYKQRVFRIHWDGDFFSLEYAEAWARVIAKHGEVRFWAYTRSFVDPVNVVPVLAELDNLSLYLSTDEYNVQAAYDIAAAYPQITLALCATDYRSGRRLAEGRPMPPVVCPENKGDMPLVTEGVGACVDCQLCVVGKRDVIFSTTHREVRAEGVPLPLFDVPVAIRGNSR